MADKICRATKTIVTGVLVFAPEPGHHEPHPIIIRPDDSGEMWYWHLTPEDIEAERVAAEAAAKAYREATA